MYVLKANPFRLGDFADSLALDMMQPESPELGSAQEFFDFFQRRSTKLLPFLLLKVLRHQIIYGRYGRQLVEKKSNEICVICIEMAILLCCVIVVIGSAFPG